MDAPDDGSSFERFLDHCAVIKRVRFDVGIGLRICHATGKCRSENRGKNEEEQCFHRLIVACWRHLLNSSGFNGSFWLQNGRIPVSINLFQIELSL